MTQWRETPDGRRQYRGEDGYWYTGGPPALPAPPGMGPLAQQSYQGVPEWRNDPNQRRINRLGPWGFVLSLLFGGIGGIAGVIMGFRARRQIRESNGVEGGMGWAVTSIIVGSLAIVGSAVYVGALVVQHGKGAGPSQATLESAVQSDATSREHIHGVSNVSCVMPGSWAQGQSFTCFVYNASGQQLAQMNGTVLPDQGTAATWNEAWQPG